MTRSALLVVKMLTVTALALTHGEDALSDLWWFAAIRNQFTSVRMLALTHGEDALNG